MALVNVTNIVVNDNPALFTRGFKFQVTFECIAPLTDGACVCGVRWCQMARRGAAALAQAAVAAGCVCGSIALPAPGAAPKVRPPLRSLVPPRFRRP